MAGKNYKLNPLSDYVESLEDWELIEYINRYKITKKWLLTEASHVTRKEVEKVWSIRYPEEPVPTLECVHPLHTLTSIQSYLDQIEGDKPIND